MEKKRNSNRKSRVATEIKKALSEFMVRNSIVDEKTPLDTSLISVTDVVVSSCLQNANVFIVSITEQIKNEDCVEFLQKHKSKFRNHVGLSMRMKYTPELRFFVDDSFEYAARINELLKKNLKI